MTVSNHSLNILHLIQVYYEPSIGETVVVTNDLYTSELPLLERQSGGKGNHSERRTSTIICSNKYIKQRKIKSVFAIIMAQCLRLYIGMGGGVVCPLEILLLVLLLVLLLHVARCVCKDVC